MNKTGKTDGSDHHPPARMRIGQYGKEIKMWVVIVIAVTIVGFWGYLVYRVITDLEPPVIESVSLKEVPVVKSGSQDNPLYIYYRRDPRTGFCFATKKSHWDGGITKVPCTPEVKRLLPDYSP